MEVAILVASILAVILSTIAIIIGALAFIEAKALKTSTHSIQFMPAENALPDEPPAPLFVPESEMPSKLDPLETRARDTGFIPLDDEDL